MSAGEKDLIQSINERLDPRALVQGINFHVDKMRELGGTLKTCCPVHKDDRFATLILYPKKNTFQCMASTCPGNKGGLLVDLYALWSGTTGVAAALGAAKLTGLELDSQMVAQLQKSYIEKAQAAAEEGNETQAREALEQAREIDSSSLLVPLVGAKIQEKAGKVDQAFQDYVVAARLARRRGRPTEAEQIVREELMRLRPEHEDTLLELAEVHMGKNETEQRNGLLLRVAASRESEGRARENVVLFERMPGVLLGHPARRMSFARALDAARDKDRAAIEYEQAGTELLDANELEGAREAFAALIRLDPENRHHRMKMAEIHRLAGRTVDCINELSALGEEALHHNNLGEAERLFRLMLDADSGSVSAREGLADILERRGESQGAIEQHLLIADAYDGMGLEDQAVEHLERARGLDPDNLELRLRLARRMLAESDPGKAIKEYLQVGKQMFGRGQAEQAIASFKELLGRMPLNVELRRSIGGVLKESAQLPVALDMAAEQARLFMGKDDLDHAQLILDEVGTDANEHAGLLRIRFDVALKRNKLAEAVACAVPLAWALEKGGEVDSVQQILEKAIELRPSDPSLREAEGQFWLRQGKAATAASSFRELLVVGVRQAPEVRKRYAQLVLDLDGTDANALTFMAKALADLGDDEGAVENFVEASDNYLERSDMEEAYRCLDLARALAPSDPRVLKSIGNLFMKQGDSRKASDAFLELIRALKDSTDAKAQREAFALAIEANPSRLEVRHAFADWLAARGDMDRAVQELSRIEKEMRSATAPPPELAPILERLCEWDAKRAEFRVRLGRIYVIMGRKEEASKKYMEAADLSSAEGDSGEALAALGSALMITPEDEVILSRIAGLYQELGRSKEATSTLHKLADVRHKHGRNEENEPDLRRILSIDPQDTPALELLAELLDSRGDINEAVELWGRLDANYEKTGQVGEQERVLSFMKHARPDDDSTRTKLVALFEKSGADEKYKAEAFDLIEWYEARSRNDEAADLLASINAKFPGDRTTRERQAAADLKRGRVDQACEIYLQIADEEAKEGDLESSIRFLKLIAEADPSRMADRLTLAARLADHGDKKEALEVLFPLCEELLASGDQESALDAGARIENIAGSEWPVISRLVDTFKAFDAHADALEAILRHVRKVGLDENPEDFISACEAGLLIDAANIYLREQLVEAFAENGRADDAVAQGLKVAELLSARGDASGARRWYQKLKDVNPVASEPRLLLARLLVGSGDTKAARKEFLELAALPSDDSDKDARGTVLSEAVRALPGDIEIGKDYAAWLRQAGKPLEAVDEYRRLSKIQVDSVELDEARDLIHLALQAMPHHRGALADLCELLDMLGEPEAGAETAAEAARAAFEEGDTEDGVMLARKAAALLPNDSVMQKLCAQMLADNGFTDDGASILAAAAAVQLDRGDATAASSLLETARRYQPDNTALLRVMVRAELMRENKAGAVLLLRELAGIHASAGHLEELEQTWREALEVDPDNLEAREGLASTLREIGPDRQGEAVGILQDLCHRYDAAGDPEKAITCCREILALKPGLVVTRTMLARFLHESNRNEEAREELFSLAKAEAERGEVEYAAGCYEKILEMDAEDEGALLALVDLLSGSDDLARYADFAIRLAYLHEKKGHPADAIKRLKELSIQDPGNLDVAQFLANVLARHGQKADAARVRVAAARRCLASGDHSKLQELLTPAEALCGEDAEALEDLGRLYLEASLEADAARVLWRAVERHRVAGSIDRAIAASTELLALSPSDGELHQQRADLFEQAQQFDLAAQELAKLSLLIGDDPAHCVSVLERLLDLAPDRKADRERYANLLSELGNDSQAIEQFLMLAAEYMKGGKNKEALRFAQNAEKIDKQYPDTHELLATLYDKLGMEEDTVRELTWLGARHRKVGHLDQSLAAYARAIELSPRDQSLHVRMGELHEAMGKPDAAAGAYREAAGISEAEGQREDAVKALELARDLLPADKEISERLAALLESLDYRDSAREERLRLAARLLDSGLIDEAQHVLGHQEDLEPENLELRERVVTLYEQAGIPELAAQVCTEVANALFKKLDDAGAVEWCDRALALRPRDVEAREILVPACKRLGDLDRAGRVLSEIADIFLEAGRLDNAVEVLEALIVFRPEDLTVHRRLADALKGLGIQDAYIDRLFILSKLQGEADELEGSLQTLREILEDRPDDTRARLAYVDVYSKTGDERDLIEDFRKLAETFLSRGMINEALDALRRARNADASRADICQLYARALLGTGKVEEALEVTIDLARRLLESGRPRDASQLLQELSEPGATNPEYHLTMGKIHRASNSRGLAMQSLERAGALFKQADEVGARADVLAQILEIDPQNVEVRKELIELCRRLGDMGRAVTNLMALGEVYETRGFDDLAEAQYRALLAIQPGNGGAWERLFSTHLRYGDETDLIKDYLSLAMFLDSQEKTNEALHYFRRVIRLDPRNVDARANYIQAYCKIGNEEDLIDDYLQLADLLILNNRVDEGARIFNKVLSLDPENLKARDRLTETQARQRRAGHSTADSAAEPGRRSDSFPKVDLSSALAPASAVEPTLENVTMADTMDNPTGSAARFLAEQVHSMEDEDDRSALVQLIENYRDMLAVNPQNANVRIKLADILQQMDRGEEALNELTEASETFFQKGELTPCIQVCERILRIKPTEQKIRVRLKQAYNKRDAFKALESAILFTDHESGSDTDGQKRPPSRGK